MKEKQWKVILSITDDGINDRNDNIRGFLTKQEIIWIVLGQQRKPAGIEIELENIEEKKV